MEKDLALLDKIIYGRIEPYIYAFSTNTIPNHLKVGDTYRSVNERLEEWKKYYPNLQKEFEEIAKVDEEVYFRDFSIHKFLEQERNRTRLSPLEVSKEVYYSKEFFKNAQIEDIKDAILDICDSYKANNNKYEFYSSKNLKSKVDFKFKRTEDYKPRPNQLEVINNFKKAIKKGRKNLLMFAVMRFGKSFTSLCCAKEMGAKLVVVVSAKADVKFEWKKTAESHKRFSEYEFLESKDLKKDFNIIKKSLSSNQRVIVFLTLQDLQGVLIKEKHKELFQQNIDLLIIDETHFGARGDKYGKVIVSSEDLRASIHAKDKDDFVDFHDAEEQIKVLDARIKLHLSGTPYRILMGSEFTKDDIIAFFQFTDIYDSQEEWNKENILNDENQEWENPYYGFPQIVRFAFNPNESSRQKMNQLKKSGITYTLSELFKPQSIKKDVINESHKKFLNEKEVLELLKIIDGSQEDENVLGFLNYKKIKEGNMCRHMVFVLPYCASCDALQTLILDHNEEFLNLRDYEIINISGIENMNLYKTPEDVKRKIQNFEDCGRKTITLTVNRMLTGSTVEFWDTMVYLKNTSSPQEYDQAIFRLQNQYIKTYKDEKGNIIKFNMKPQTILVDFDPTRMFEMQEQKSQIYNVNTDESGNARLEERLRKELQISPIIALNHNKFVQITPTDILEKLSNYSRDKGVVDEVSSLPVDLNLMSNELILNVINAQGKIGSKKGLSYTPAIEEGNEIDSPLDNENESSESGDRSSSTKTSKEEDPYKEFREKFKMYYARILFFAFLTKDKVKSTDDVIFQMDKNENKRISKNLSLNKEVLKLIRKNINPFYLSQLDYKIQNLNNLSLDETISPKDKSLNVISRFNRLSSSEVITSFEVCNKVIDLLPETQMVTLLNSNHPVLDIASKSAEFALSFFYKYKDKVNTNLSDLIYSISTSPAAYEFTRKVYELLGLNVNNISTCFYSETLLGIKDTDKIDFNQIATILKQRKSFSKINLSEKIKGGKEMNFSVIVGNPPYQVSDGGAQASSKPIYHHFVDISKNLSPDYIAMITPTRWFAGGKGLDEFRDSMINDQRIQVLHDYLTPSNLFPNTNIRGGVCYFLWNKNYNNGRDMLHVITHDKGNIISDIRRPVKFGDEDIFVRDGRAFSILNKIQAINVTTLEDIVSSRKPFGLEGAFVKSSKFKEVCNDEEDNVICIGKNQKSGFVNRSLVKQNVEWIDRWKVFIPRANNIGTELNDDNLNAFIGRPGMICTESYLVVGGNLSLKETEARNLVKFLQTKFVRFLHSLAKASQDATSKTFKFVPVEDFTKDSIINWNESLNEIDRQLCKIYNFTNEEISYLDSAIKDM